MCNPFHRFANEIAGDGERLMGQVFREDWIVFKNQSKEIHLRHRDRS